MKNLANVPTTLLSSLYHPISITTLRQCQPAGEYYFAILVLKLSLAHPCITPSTHNGNRNTYREFLIELISQEGVGQLPKVELAEGAHTVDVLEVHFPCQIWTLI